MTQSLIFLDSVYKIRVHTKPCELYTLVQITFLLQLRTVNDLATVNASIKQFTEREYLLSTLEAKTSSVKFFVGENFRHLPKISSLFADELFTDKVYIIYRIRLFNLLIHKVFSFVCCASRLPLWIFFSYLSKYSLSNK